MQSRHQITGNNAMQPISCPCVDLSSGFLSQRAILGLKKTIPVTSWLLRLLVTHFPSSSSQTLFRANSPTLHSDLGCPTHHEGPKHGSMPSRTDTQAPGSSDPPSTSGLLASTLYRLSEYLSSTQTLRNLPVTIIAGRKGPQSAEHLALRRLQKVLEQVCSVSWLIPSSATQSGSVTFPHSS